MRDIIKLNNIVKNYHIGTILVEALKNVSLNIKENEYVALMGPSGSGKSTLLHIIALLDQPTTGEVFFRNKNFSKSSEIEKDAIEKLGFVFQFHHLLPEFTIYENLLIPKMIAENHSNNDNTDIFKMVEFVGLTHRINHYPNEISGGERQRVAVARALTHNPFLILADEPTGNLDEYSANIIWELLEGANQQLETTIIVVTHSIPVNFAAPYRKFKINNGEINEIF